MSQEKKVTYHACPICKKAVPNDIQKFRYHLNNVCGVGLFNNFPELKSKGFNYLWYKLTDYIKEKKIIVSKNGKISFNNIITPLLPINPPSKLPPLKIIQTNNSNDNIYQQYLPKLIENNNNNNANKSVYQYKYITNNNNDNKSKNKNNDNDTKKKRKKKILYGNAGDIKPPKRINNDCTINMQLFKHKINQSRTLYHKVSFEDFQNRNIDHYSRNPKKRKLNKKISVDNHNALINAQNALDRYLNTCKVLRKIFIKDIHDQITQRFFENYGDNNNIIIQDCLEEINYWNEYISDDKRNNDDKIWNENYKKIWDKLMQNMDNFGENELNKILNNNELCGDNINKNNTFWNDSNNLNETEYNIEVFRGMSAKKFVSL